MTPSEIDQQIGAACRSVVEQLRDQHPDAEPTIIGIIGVFGSALASLLDHIPQEARVSVAKSFCDTLMADVRSTIRFDA